MKPSHPNPDRNLLIGLGYIQEVLLRLYPLFKIAVLHSTYLDTAVKDQLITSFQKILTTVADAHKRSRGDVPPTRSQLARRRAEKKEYEKRRKEAERLTVNR